MTAASVPAMYLRRLRSGISVARPPRTALLMMGVTVLLTAVMAASVFGLVALRYA